MPSASGLRVLVVDDSEDTAECLALLVRLWGYGARVCCDARAAVGAAQAYRPHVVLLDIGMPEMDGFEIVRRLGGHPELRQAVLVAVTGHAGAAYESCARVVGFAHYLIKPVDPDELRELLRGLEERAGVPEATLASPEAASLGV